MIIYPHIESRGYHIRHRAVTYGLTAYGTVYGPSALGRTDALAPVGLLGGGLDHLDVGQRLLGRDARRPPIVLAEGGPVDLRVRRDERVDLVAHVAGEARVGGGRAGAGGVGEHAAVSGGADAEALVVAAVEA